MYEMTGLSNTTPTITTVMVSQIVNAPVELSYVDIYVRCTDTITIRAITTCTLDNIY